MKTKFSTSVITILALVALVRTSQVAGQRNDNDHKHHHYKLVEIETFDGPSSISYFGDAQSLNDKGVLVGFADTSTQDPNFPNSNPYLTPDPFIHHAFLWSNGDLTDLGALPGTNHSEVGWVNERGIAVGSSTNGSIDPLTGWPAEVAVLWFGNQVISLGTLGGNESQADAINNRGQIAGFAANTVPDSFPSPISLGLPGFGAQQRAFLWENGVMHDLGTLGGPDAAALLLNERGQIAGVSYISSTPNASGSPNIDPFLWEKGKMLDLGSFGGTFGSPNWLNNRGQVVGYSSLPGDSAVHPFLWSEHEGMKDLGTLGGTFGLANWVNEKGDVVGTASTQGEQARLGFLWKNGIIRNLGVLAGDACSVAININAQDQIVGSSVLAANCSSDSGRAFLWEDGDLIDLNSDVPAGSALTLTQGEFINDRGEILASATLPNGDLRSILLIPCDDHHPGVEGCDYTLVAAGDQANTAASNPRHTKPINAMIESLRRRSMPRYRNLGVQPPPK